MPEYRIDELAQAAGTTTRNVRSYQERGVLPPPRLHGRVGIYDDTHLTRLRLIDSLLQRGFTTAHIADFITSWESGKDLAEVLGLQEAVTSTWAKDEDLVIPIELVSTFLGPGGDDLLDRLVDMRLARIDGDSCVITEPELFESFAALYGYDFELRELLDIYVRVAEGVEDIAQHMISRAKQHIVDKHGEGWLPDSDGEISHTTAMITHMRELGVTAVHATLARALDRVLQQELGNYLAVAAQHRTKSHTA